MSPLVYILRVQLAGLLLLGATDLAAQGREPLLNLSWKDVPRARGYMVQIRDVGGKKILDRRTQASEIDFSLAIGNYSVRMAAVNKFNKPGTWSQWHNIRIRRSAEAIISRVDPPEVGLEEKTTIDVIGQRFFRSSELSLQRGDEIYKYETEYIDSTRLRFALTKELAAGQYDVVLRNPGGKVTRSRSAFRVREQEAPPTERETPPDEKPEERPTEKDPVEEAQQEGFYWKAFAPGLPEAGSLSGYIWPGTVAGLLLASGYELNQARLAREQFVSDPLSAAYSNPSLLVGAAGSGLGTAEVFYGANSLSNLSRLDRNESAHTSRAALYGGTALALYAGHALRYRFGFSSRPVDAGALLPGLASFQEGQIALGSAWALGFAGLTAVAVSNYNQANDNVRTLENDPLYSVFNDPALLTGLRLANTNRDEITLPVYIASQRYAEIESNYTANQNRFLAASGGAALVYLAHYLLYQPRSVATASKSEQAAAAPEPEDMGFILDIYPEAEGDRKGTRAEFRLRLVVP